MRFPHDRGLPSVDPAREHRSASRSGPEGVCRQNGKRHVAVSIESYAVAPTILATSDLLCTLPRRFLTRFTDTLDLFEPPVPLPPVEITAYWHPRNHEDPAHQWMRTELFAAASAVGRR
jgi:DNA-binding transcriptional LysR family regulator